MKHDGAGATASEIAEAAERLRAAGAQLRERTRTQALDAACAVLELWRAPESPWRRRLEDEIGERCGFSLATVREGLARGLEPWTSDALRALVRSELGADHPAPHSSGERRIVSGFEITSVLLAGSIPMPSILSLLLPLVLRSPVLAKPASRDLVTAPLFAASLAEVDALLARSIESVSFASEDAQCAAAFFASPCVVATGSDVTLAQVAAFVKPPQRLVGYGHRLSIAVLGEGASSGAALDDAARGLALDVALWDQQGCLSPVAVYVEDPDSGAVGRVAEALARALDRIEERLPRGSVPRQAAAEIARERDEARMRAAAPRPVAVHASKGTQWTVVREDDARLRPAPLHRFVRVHPVATRAELRAALRPLSPHLAAVAIAGFGSGDAQRELARQLAMLGASRLCVPGQMQSPPLGWHHDGQSVLLPMARVSDLECDRPS